MLILILIIINGQLSISETLNNLSETHYIKPSPSVNAKTVPQVASTASALRVAEPSKPSDSEPSLSATPTLSMTTHMFTGIYIN